MVVLCKSNPCIVESSACCDTGLRLSNREISHIRLVYDWCLGTLTLPEVRIGTYALPEVQTAGTLQRQKGADRGDWKNALERLIHSFIKVEIALLTVAGEKLNYYHHLQPKCWSHQRSRWMDPCQPQLY